MMSNISIVKGIQLSAEVGNDFSKLNREVETDYTFQNPLASQKAQGTSELPDANREDLKGLIRDILAAMSPVELTAAVNQLKGEGLDSATTQLTALLAGGDFPPTMASSSSQDAEGATSLPAWMASSATAPLSTALAGHDADGASPDQSNALQSLLHKALARLLGDSATPARHTPAPADELPDTDLPEVTEGVMPRLDLSRSGRSNQSLSGGALQHEAAAPVDSTPRLNPEANNVSQGDARSESAPQRVAAPTEGSTPKLDPEANNVSQVGTPSGSAPQREAAAPEGSTPKLAPEASHASQGDTRSGSASQPVAAAPEHSTLKLAPEASNVSQGDARSVTGSAPRPVPMAPQLPLNSVANDTARSTLAADVVSVLREVNSRLVKTPEATSTPGADTSQATTAVASLLLSLHARGTERIQAANGRVEGMAFTDVLKALPEANLEDVIKSLFSQAPAGTTNLSGLNTLSSLISTEVLDAGGGLTLSGDTNTSGHTVRFMGQASAFESGIGKNIMAFIADQMARTDSKDNAEYSLKLYPKSLGEVNVSIQQHANSMNIAITMQEDVSDKVRDQLLYFVNKYDTINWRINDKEYQGNRGNRSSQQGFSGDVEELSDNTASVLRHDNKSTIINLII